MIPLKRLTSSVLMFSLLAVFPHGPLHAIGRADDATSVETGLQFRLSHGIAQPEKRTATTPAAASELSQSEIETVLKRLPPMKTDAVVLEALITDQPNNDLIPKIVRGLLADRVHGRWSSTQENIFVLLALDRYFNTYEKVTPAFVARVWLGNRYAGEQSFKGRSVDRQRVNVPMRYLAENDSVQNLVISKGGEGRLYYRLAMSYAPLNSDLQSADYGFAVDRVYEALDDPEDVRHEPDGTWRIKLVRGCVYA